MSRRPESPQPTLPGMEHLGAQFTPAKARLGMGTRRPNQTARQWSGPIPGQTVLGANEPEILDSPRGGPWTADPTGFIPEHRSWESKDSLYGYYGTHGGSLAKTFPEHFADSGWTQQQIDERVAAHPAYFREDAAKVQRVRDHWSAQPLHQIRADTPVHTGQHWQETTEDAGARAKVDKIRSSLESGEPIREATWLMKSQGRLYSLDGHHRVLAARESGLSHYPARVWDLDKHTSALNPQQFKTV